ncbi:MAG: hypothetical protein N2C13_06275 [Chloroflexota bacterium]
MLSLTILIAACSPAAAIERTPTQIDIATLESAAPYNPTNTAPPTLVETPTAIAAYIVRIHPDDGLYVGDLVSIEIEGLNDTENSRIEIQIDPPDGPTFGAQPFVPTGLVGESLATFFWVWDTSNLEPGQHTIQFQILDNGPQWQQTVTLYRQDELPPQALETVWESQSSQCCTLYYLTNTASEREIMALMAEIDAQAENVALILSYAFDQPTTIILMPRVIGHGGFATQDIYISYLDRNYAGSSLSQVLHHEFVHIVDRQLGGEFRPTILTEGYAVYHSGGHFKKEALIPRAAALLELDWYIPLTILANNFYTQQHEIGYLEAGALIEFMIAEWGETAFEEFYRDMQPPGERSHTSSINQALRAHFDLTLVELNALFYTHLRNHPVDPLLRSDVENTIGFYDTVRRYQMVLDTSAYYLDAWFLSIDEMLEGDITSDYYRHPESPENITVEVMLVSAFEHLLNEEYGKSEALIATINTSLGHIENGNSNPFSEHPLSRKYFQVVMLLLESGYSPQQISFDLDAANALVLNKKLELIKQALVFENAEWLFE